MCKLQNQKETRLVQDVELDLFHVVPWQGSSPLFDGRWCPASDHPGLGLGLIVAKVRGSVSTVELPPCSRVRHLLLSPSGRQVNTKCPYHNLIQAEAGPAPAPPFLHGCPVVSLYRYGHRLCNSSCWRRQRWWEQRQRGRRRRLSRWRQELPAARHQEGRIELGVLKGARPKHFAHVPTLPLPTGALFR